MRRYIVLLLITGIVWAQTDFDKLVLKDGTTYFGEYIKIDGEKVFFKTKDAFALHLVSLRQIESLELKDGQILYDVSKGKKGSFVANVFTDELIEKYDVSKGKKGSFVANVFTDELIEKIRAMVYTTCAFSIVTILYALVNGML